MVWSEQTGTSIILPADHVDGDGRNYIVIGEAVPSNISDHFTAALVFRNGKYLESNEPYSASGFVPPAGFVYPGNFIYYAIGITTSGALELVSFFYEIPSQSSEQYNTYRQTIWSITAPTTGSQPGQITPPVFSLGAIGGTYNEGSVTVQTQALALINSATPVLTGVANFGSGYDPVVVKQLATGEIHLDGVLKNVSGATLGDNTGGVNPQYVIMTLPVWARPTARKVFLSFYANTGGFVRIDVDVNGAVTLNTAVTNGSFFSLNDVRYRP